MKPTSKSATQPASSARSEDENEGLTQWAFYLFMGSLALAVVLMLIGLITF
jgi:hypothetical protein